MLFGSKVIMFFFSSSSSSFKKGHQAALWSREVAMVLPNPFKNDLSEIDS